MTEEVEHRIAFRGSVRWRQLESSDSDLIVTDRESSRLVAPRPGDVFVDQLRPDRGAIETASKAIRDAAPNRIVAVGGGCAIDTAKLAWLAAGPNGTQLVIAPCGREPWRAFAPFAVELDSAGGQSTTVDAKLSRHEVVIDRQLLDTLSDDLLLLTALDVLVSSIESLLTRRGQPYSRALANAAGSQVIGAIGVALDGARPDAESVIVASALATEAFTSAGLGLAHGISTHLAALLEVPQDRINAIAGRWVVDRWGDHRALAGLRGAAALIEPRDRSILELVDAALDRLDLGTLGDEGVVEVNVDSVLPLISDSSGIPWLPDELGPEAIRDVVQSLCNGASRLTRETVADVARSPGEPNGGNDV